MSGRWRRRGVIAALLALLAGAVLPPWHAAAQTPNGGSLVFGEAIVPAGCRNYFSVSTKLGYSIIERLGGVTVIQRDSLSGPIEQIGSGQIMDETRHQPISVYVTEIHLSRQQYQARILQLCH